MHQDNDTDDSNIHSNHGQDDNDYIHNQRRGDGGLCDCCNLRNLQNDSIFNTTHAEEGRKERGEIEERGTGGGVHIYIHNG